MLPTRAPQLPANDELLPKYVFIKKKNLDFVSESGTGKGTWDWTREGNLKKSNNSKKSTKKSRKQWSTIPGS